MLFQRLVALVLIALPGAIAVIGWSMMKDAVYSFWAQQGFLWGTFLGGFLLFAAGLGFLAGFLFYRDKKRKLIQPRFLRKKR